MLLVLEVKGLENLNLKDMEAGKKVKVEGIVQCMYFDENYIKAIEEKAQKYDDLMNLGEAIVESMFSSAGEKEAKEKSIEILKDSSKLGFLGHNIKARNGLNEAIKRMQETIQEAEKN